jgi:hypothetical protein
MAMHMVQCTGTVTVVSACILMLGVKAFCFLNRLLFLFFLQDSAIDMDGRILVTRSETLQENDYMPTTWSYADDQKSELSA